MVYTILGRKTGATNGAMELTTSQGDPLYQSKDDSLDESKSFIVINMEEGSEGQPRSSRTRGVRPKRGNGKRKTRRGTRATKNSAALNVALNDVVHQLDGAIDAGHDRRDVLLDVEAKEPPLLCYVSAPEYHLGNNAKRHHREIKDGFYYIQGFFQFNGVPRYVHGRFLAHDGLTPVVEASDCGLLLYTHDACDAVPLFNQGFSDVNVDDRLWQALDTCILHATILNGFDTLAFVRQCRRFYCSHWTPYPALESDLRRRMQSPRFQSMLKELVETNAELWLTRLLLSVKMACSETGVDYEDRYLKVERRLAGSTLQFTSALAFLVLGASFVPVSVMLAATVALFGGIFSVVVCRQGAVKTEDVLLAMRKELTPGVNNPRMIPAARVWLEKEMVDPDRIPTATRGGVELKTDYVSDASFAQRDEVDIFGTTIPGPIVYPDSGSQNLHAAVAMRMASGNHGEEAANRSLYAYCCRLIDQLPTLEIPDASSDDKSNYLCRQYGQNRGRELSREIDLPLDDSHIPSQIFVKREVYLGKTQETMKPRMIWPRNSRVVAHYSLLFHRISEAIQGMWNGRSTHGSDIFYTCRATPDDVGGFVEGLFSRHAHVSESDVSSWDGSINPTLLAIEKYFFTTKVETTEDTRWLEEQWDRVVGLSRNREVSVNMKHGRRSGDLWTSCFNSLLNVLIVMWVYGLEWTDDFSMIVLGDDNIVGLGETPRVDAVAAYASIGMKCDVLVRADIEETSYCSGRFWRVGDSYRWGISPFRAFQKLGVNNHDHPKKLWKGLLYGSAKSLLPVAGHIPIIGAFLRTICDTAKSQGVRAHYDVRDRNPYRIQGGLCLHPDSQTYAQFCDRYGMSLEVVARFEETIRNVCHIDDCPYLLVDDYFVQGLSVDLEQECGVPMYRFDPLVESKEIDDWEETVVQAPILEEIDKLGNGSRSFAESMARAREYGEAENRYGPHLDHVKLHQMFTGISYVNLRCGVAVHRAYNVIAYYNRLLPAAKRKNGGGGKKKAGKPARRNNNGANAPVQASTVGGVLKALVKAGLIGAGTLVGNTLVPGAGGVVGGALGRGLSRVIGSGDYKVVKNSLIGAPSFGSTDSVRYRGRDVISVVTGSTAFSSQEFRITPTNRLLFPSLAGVCAGWSQYSFKGLIGYYDSTSSGSVSSTNTALGVVIMATQLDANKRSFRDSMEMLNHTSTTSSIPSDSFFHPLECDPRLQSKAGVLFVEEGNEGISDRNEYDYGVLTLATEGMQAAATIGYFIVSYDIEFMGRRESAAVRTPTLYTAGAWTLAEPLGTTLGVPKGTHVDIASGGVIDLSPYRGATVIMTADWFGSTTLTWTSIPTITLSNATNVQSWDDGTRSFVGFDATDRAHISQVFTVSTDMTVTPTATISNLYISGGTPEGVQLIISEINLDDLFNQ